MPPYILEGLPERLRGDAVAWDSGQPVPAPSVLAGVEVFVPPYTATAADLSLMARMPALRLVQPLTAGVDNVLEHLPPGVLLCNAAGVHDASTAELAVGLTIASLRHLDDFARAMPAGQWRYARHEALADKRVLIVGFGSIGRAIARRLEGFECQVQAVARTARVADGVTVRAVADLPALLPTADVVVLIVPLTEQTRGMVDADFLARMPDGALLVNVARGQVVVTDALRAECASGRLRAALDVTDPEPLPAGHPLWRTPNVLVSPHVGGNTSAFIPRARRLVAAQLDRWCAQEPLLNVVDTDRDDPDPEPAEGWPEPRNE
jgi:phosphoglycerate dehydrogenase-like enzyme